MSKIEQIDTERQFSTFVVQEENFGARLDVFVGEAIQGSRSNAQKKIISGLVLLNGMTEDKTSKTLKIGDRVDVAIVSPQSTELIPQDIPIDIVYQDEYLAVINKQQGLTVHPAGGSYRDTLVNALLYHVKDLSGINGDIRPGIVHRLDKDTSGLMVVAKNDFAHVELSRQISTKECRRIYYALTEGVFKEDSGVIDAPLFRSKTDRKKIAVDPNGRKALTLFDVVKRFPNNTLVRYELKTGRTHQIRVHSAFIGHPIVGDKTYGFKKQKFELDGQLLHSKEIVFTHPKTKETMHFDSELPNYFKRILQILKK